MDVWNEQAVFYYNCKFRDPRGRGFGIRVGPKWSLMKYFFNHQSNNFQIWHEASLGQGAHKL